ncbi:glycoside hydrolase family 51 protein [Athelia psychrophila]|uniref:non-reducing end alpha-L-arabinofuranosidase n=1 Tax=Athelia psychrophila TaxID=1759441 RepID=A0A166C9G3_9AGAM|nr:glycoside hydrolase family 51 protein [Fibularhizoctonia sp. CBS 109695]
MPKVFHSSAALAAIFFATAITECWSHTTVVINATASHAIPSTLLLQNRAFQQVNISGESYCILDQVDALTAWSAIGSNNTIAVIADPSPLTSALPNSLQLSIPQNSTGSVGFENSGYWGINANASWTYSASLYYRFPNSSTFSGPLNISLQSSSGAILASASFNISGAQVGTNWTQLNTTFTPTVSGLDTNNTFAVTLDGTAASGETLNFALLSLFPPTYKGRANGMRVDIAESMAGIGPSFFRLPGGNNLGQTVDTRWQWNGTVGPLIDRPGRVGDWGYANTDGLGLYEYMTFCEDVGMDAIMAVWAGYAFGESIAQADLQPYIQQAIDQINFVINNDTSSGPAAIRASMGHPEPFNLTYVEVGNEPQFNFRYGYRWTAYLANLTTLFPDLKFIATSYPFDPVLTPTPLQYDVHVYQTPTWFAENSFYYDDFERNGTQYFEGEYASTSTNASSLYGTAAEGRFLFPEVQGSVGEAAFMTGLERNADIVFAASYAPLLGVRNTVAYLTPNLIGFDAGSVIQSTSYYVQQMFSLNRGDVYLPSTLPSANGTLFWSVTKKNATNELFIKVANTIATAQNITFQLPFSNVSSTGSVQLLTRPLNASNTPEVPDAVTPSIGDLTTNATFEWTAPGYSVAVLTVNAQ